ncbi:MAG: serine hydrolase [Chloroflexota bacterium]
MPKQRGKIMPNWILIIVLLVIGAVIAGVSFYIDQLFRTKSELAEFIRLNPNTTAIAAYTIDEHGERVEDGSEIFENADLPLVVASTMKIIVLAAYEDAVARGEFDPGEQVAMVDLERYYLPVTDGGAHAAGLASLGLAADASGFARDQNATIGLDDVARIMMHNSGNAETDYLIARLGAERIASVMALAGLEQHTPLQPVLGITLALFNHEVPLTNTEQRQALINQVANGDFSSLESLMDLYLHDQSWRAAQIAFMQSEEFVAAAGQIGWEGQAAASQLFPKGTAREYARLMAKIASGQFISPEVSARMQQKLESVPSDWPLRLLFHRRYGAKDGVTAGVLALASYAVPKNGLLAGQPRVVVILTNELPYETWAAQLQAQGIYLLETDLARAAGVFNQLADSR